MNRRVAVALAAASLLALAGCDGVVGAKMTFDDTEKAKVTDIVLTGGSADVMVTTGTATETRIKREVRGSTDPGPSYELSGAILTLPTDCGRDCHVTYQIEAPAGVAVRGDLSSGDVMLERVGPVDLKLTSGDIGVHGATGPVKIRATSGDLVVNGAPEVSLECTSGDLTAQEIAGPITARASSGDMLLGTSVPASVTATVSSGNLDVSVPRGSYQVRTDTSSGDESVDPEINDVPNAEHKLDLRTRSGDLNLMAGLDARPAPEAPEGPSAPAAPRSPR
ncbi:DUF4097 family beta strand repeat-containing protein [Actinoplanes sp. NPDC051861]|uniref:DUF4097 family beta strand repeat-containing protein n=1 Tax=Actinoplanes sp. NPDC051861 TaxID=3155170 RepID=UPI0034428462